MSGLRARLAEERGFTMILAIMVLLIAMSVGVGAWTAASGDVGNGSYAHDQKRVATVAEAVRLGSNMLVLGRAVTAAPDPAAALAAARAECLEAMSEPATRGEARPSIA